MKRRLPGIGALLLLCHPESAEALNLKLRADQFVRSELLRPGDAQAIRRGGTLSGGERDWGMIGWVEYDFNVPNAGWHELFAHPGAQDAQIILDPGAAEEVNFFGTAGRIGDAEKIGNAWLRSGEHRLRIQRYYWTGMPRTAALEIRESRDSPARFFRAWLPGDRRQFRTGECPAMQLQLGGGDAPARVRVVVQTPEGRAAMQSDVSAPAGPPVVRSVSLPCTGEGRFIVSFAGTKGQFPWPEARPVDYEVIDTRAGTQAGNGKPVLIREIDCITQAPHYSGGGVTRIASSPAGTYRESGDHGFTRWQRLPEVARALLPEPSWFAYRIEGLVPQQQYTIEIDYPDDALRTFAIALRERAPLAYPLAGGVDSGGMLAVSRRMQTRRMTFWARTTDPRIVFLTAHDGRRAAAARIRVYRDGFSPPASRSQGRSFMNWYEEGANFSSLYGAPDDWYQGPREAIDRWVASLADSGGNILVPSVGVYSFSLYPSRYMRTFSHPDSDLLRRLLLQAEKFGFKVLPEIHPRADDLDLQFAGSPDPKPNLLISRDGRSNFFANDGTTRNYPPLHNPLHPATREWYLGLVGEIGTRYQDSPALLGVNLRLMSWANPSLNNFHSLEWGYGDDTIASFARESGLAVPMGKAGDPGRFNLRQRWIAANASSAWTEWRCAKITALHAAIRDRLRAIRSDLRLYISVFPWGERPDTASAWRDAGVDLKALAELDGVVIVDADQGYGRREADEAFERRQRAALLSPADLGMPERLSRAFLTGTYYLEATDAVVPPASLGFPPETRRTWMSAVATPAGRNSLEPYALQIARSDANLLGVGGNGYSLGDPLLRAFLSEYRALPVEPFAIRSGPDDAVVVRQLARTDDTILYAVNRTAERVRVDIRLSAASRLTRLRDGAPVAADTDRLALDLDGFELVVLRATGRSHVLSAFSRPLP